MCQVKTRTPPLNQKKNQKKIKKKIKKIKKKSNFTCTLEHDQPPSDQNRSKPIKTDQNRLKPIKTDQNRSKKNQISPVH